MGVVSRHWGLFALILLVVLTLDLATKSWALSTLEPGAQTELLGGVVPMTLHFNTGGLWGIGRDQLQRWFFPVATLIALLVLANLYRQTDHRFPGRRLAIPMIAAGALGNLVDRLRWERGVVDFIGPFDLGFMTWPIFNVADMAISCCTIFLVYSLWRYPEPDSEDPSEAASAA